jgi:hypothetical protein
MRKGINPMRTLLLLLLPLILLSPGQNSVVPTSESSVVVLGFKSYKARQAVEKSEPLYTGPAPAMTAANKNYSRNARLNDPVGARDPNADTIDARSAAIEKNVQEAHAPQLKPVDGYAYRVKVQNTSARVIEILFFEYQFVDPADSANVAHRQFLCGVNIKPDKGKELQAFSISGPSDVISVGSLSKKSETPFQERVVINRVEYADGTIWQRKDWNFGEIVMGYRRAIATPWSSEMCRGL